MITVPVGTHPCADIAHAYMILDDEDADLAARKWTLNAGYATCSAGWSHRMILERKLGRKLQAGEVTDHINGSRLDNRRPNLRALTRAQNNRHRAGSTVQWSERSHLWRVVIPFKGEKIYCGSFHDIDAAEQRARAAMRDVELGIFGDTIAEHQGDDR